jgi:hydrogenase expression/formation protein HypC
MCLAIPGRVLSVTERELRMARVEFGGVVKEICLAYVPEAVVGDYVVVHAGFAISRVDADEAARVLSYFEE